MTKQHFVLAVFNQSQSQTFQRMLESMACEFGPCFIYSGTTFPTNANVVTIKVAPRYVRGSFIARAMSWLKYMLSACPYLFSLPRQTFVLATTNPPLLPHLVWLICSIRRMSYGILVWDIYPDYLVEIGWFKSSGLIARLWRRLNAEAMRGAAFVVTLGNNMASVLRTQLREIDADREIEVITNWTDTCALRPMGKSSNPFAAAYGQDDKLTILYSGNIGAAFGMEVIAEAASLLRDKTHISFLLVGDGLGRRLLEARVKALDLSNVLFLPLQPVELLPFSLSTGDIGLVFQSPVAANLMMPSKTYDLMAAGCALIACTPSNSDLAKTVEEHGLGIVCPPLNAAALASAIDQLAASPLLLESCRKRARAVALSDYSATAVELRWKILLANAIRRRTHAC